MKKTSTDMNRFNMNCAVSKFIRSLMQLDFGYNAVERNHEHQHVIAEFTSVRVAQEFLRLLSRHTRSKCTDSQVSPSIRTIWERFGKRVAGLSDDPWTLDLVPTDEEAESLGGKRFAKWLRKVPKLKTFGLRVTFPETDLFFANECLAAFIDEDDKEGGDRDGEVEVAEEDDEPEEKDAEDHDDEEALARYEAGRRAGRWWAEHKAEDGQVEQFAKCQVEMRSSYLDITDPIDGGGLAYDLSEHVYFVLHLDDYGNRTRARDFWECLEGEFDSRPTGDTAFVEGFVVGLLEMAGVRN